MDRALDHDEQEFLLRLARSTIAARLAGEPLPKPEVAAGPLTARRGAFVTLTIDGQLRGCIGHVVGVEPLWRSVRSNALAAAFSDPRFPPLELAELDRIAIEISAMSALAAVADPGEIEVGRHGLLIELDPARGLLLPQVASHNRWDRETFLDQTCRKAGLPPGRWRDSAARLFSFTVQSFAEE